MKIRTGFVSNSSSSSFCILGFRVTDAVEEAIKEHAPKEVDEILEDAGLEFWDTEDGKFAGISIQGKTLQSAAKIKEKLLKTIKSIGLKRKPSINIFGGSEYQ
jgi:hypothetical protein